MMVYNSSPELSPISKIRGLQTSRNDSAKEETSLVDMLQLESEQFDRDSSAEHQWLINIPLTPLASQHVGVPVSLVKLDPKT
jgi:hypothetical protein